MIVTWYRNACVAVETENAKVLFDPYIPNEGFDTSEYEQFHTIFLTNENPVCLKGISGIIGKETEVFCNAGAAIALLNMGVDGNCIHVLEIGDRRVFRDIEIKALEGPEFTSFYSEASGMAGGFNNIFRHFRRETIRKTFVFLIETEGKSVLLLPGQNLPENILYPKNPELMILPYCGNQNVALDIFRWIRPAKVLLHSWDAGEPVSLKTDTRSLKILMKQECPEIAVAKPSRTRSYAF